MVGGAIEAAPGSATTDWATFSGPMPDYFVFHAIFFPVAMGAFLIMPGIICFFALGFGRRGRIVPYQPAHPAHPARFEIKDMHHGSVHNAQVADV